MAARTYLADASGNTVRPRKVYIIDSTGAAKHVTKVFIVDATGTTRQVYAAIPVVTISPNPLQVVQSSGNFSGTVAATVTGGTGSYTYVWTHAGGDPTITISGPSDTAFATFQATVSPSNAKTAFKRCTVTDTSTGLVGFAEVEIMFERF